MLGTCRRVAECAFPLCSISGRRDWRVGVSAIVLVELRYLARKVLQSDRAFLIHPGDPQRDISGPLVNIVAFLWRVNLRTSSK